ncbi:hypothetical protein ABZ776_13970 [Streptomyces sp. NPDC007076]|uniref:hypothetical protein n=1 Tax=unclassified Streptomyces TaxID=2593676 RepID=UPI002E76FD3F|nr:hypothetical protein [Streptomyces sp. JV190]MEE1843847.1 hypothetical protein [Streptomyces sp. JV190]
MLDTPQFQVSNGPNAHRGKPGELFLSESRPPARILQQNVEPGCGLGIHHCLLGLHMLRKRNGRLPGRPGLSGTHGPVRIFPAPLTLRALDAVRGSEGLPSMNRLHRAIPELFPVQYRAFLPQGLRSPRAGEALSGAQS